MTDSFRVKDPYFPSAADFSPRGEVRRRQQQQQFSAPFQCYLFIFSYTLLVFLLWHRRTQRNELREGKKGKERKQEITNYYADTDDKTTQQRQLL